MCNQHNMYEQIIRLKFEVTTGQVGRRPRNKNSGMEISLAINCFVQWGNEEVVYWFCTHTHMSISSFLHFPISSFFISSFPIPALANPSQMREAHCLPTVLHGLLPMWRDHTARFGCLVLRVLVGFGGSQGKNWFFATIEIGTNIGTLINENDWYCGDHNSRREVANVSNDFKPAGDGLK